MTTNEKLDVEENQITPDEEPEVELKADLAQQFDVTRGERIDLLNTAYRSLKKQPLSRGNISRALNKIYAYVEHSELFIQALLKDLISTAQEAAMLKVNFQKLELKVRAIVNTLDKCNVVSETKMKEEHDILAKELFEQMKEAQNESTKEDNPT